MPYSPRERPSKRLIRSRKRCSYAMVIRRSSAVQILARVLIEHLTRRATVTFLTAITDQPGDFGRVVSGTNGQVCEIVEMKRATERQRAIREINSGVYCFDRAWLWPTLQTLPRNASGEYYLTDLVGIASLTGTSNCDRQRIALTRLLVSMTACSWLLPSSCCAVVSWSSICMQV